MCLKTAPVNFISLPSYSWQTCLKFTSIQLELLTDIDMYLLLERNLRGGICNPIKRHAKANDKYMGDMHDKNKKSIYLQYLDANNLYGYAMSQKLLVGKFKWEKNTTIFSEEYIRNYNKNSDKGHFIEADWECPKELQSKFSDLQFFSERIITNKKTKIKKLACTLDDKKNYLCHINIAQLALKHGLKLKKVNRVITFDQSCWYKRYIEENTKHRTKARTKFEKDLLKLLNNSVFEKNL